MGEHRYTAIVNMVEWRRVAKGADVTSLVHSEDNDVIAFCRGRTACVAINNRENETWDYFWNITFPSGKYCNIIQSMEPSECESVEVLPLTRMDSYVHLKVPPMEAVAFHIASASKAEEESASGPAVADPAPKQDKEASEVPPPEAPKEPPWKPALGVPLFGLTLAALVGGGWKWICTKLRCGRRNSAPETANDSSDSDDTPLGSVVIEKFSG